MKLFKKKTELGQRLGTPGAAQSVYSYYQNRSASDSSAARRPHPREEIPQRKKRRVIQHIPTLMLVIAVFLCLLFISSVDINPKIVILPASQQDDSVLTLRQETTYQEAAKEFMERSVVNRSKLLIDVNGLEAYLKKEFPEIAAVSVTTPFINRRPIIEIKPTKPAFILSNDRQSVLVGNNGVALIDVRDVQNLGLLDVRSVTDESGLISELGKPALPQEQAVFISTVVEQLEKQGSMVSSLSIPASPYDLNVRITGQAYIVKFNVLEDPLQQAGSYLALKKRLQVDKITPREYIDVRVGERVFYR